MQRAQLFARHSHVGNHSARDLPSNTIGIAGVAYAELQRPPEPPIWLGFVLAAGWSPALQLRDTFAFKTRHQLVSKHQQWHPGAARGSPGVGSGCVLSRNRPRRMLCTYTFGRSVPATVPRAHAPCQNVSPPVSIAVGGRGQCGALCDRACALPVPCTLCPLCFVPCGRSRAPKRLRGGHGLTGGPRPRRRQGGLPAGRQADRPREVPGRRPPDAPPHVPPGPPRCVVCGFLIFLLIFLSFCAFLAPNSFTATHMCTHERAHVVHLVFALLYG